MSYDRHALATDEGRTESIQVGEGPVPVKGLVAGTQFLDRFRVKKNDDPLAVYMERLRRFFGKDGVLIGNRLWIPWGGNWTYCEAVLPDDKAERERGIVYIHRAVFVKTA